MKYLFVVLALSLFLVSCTPAEKACTADNDCVPNACCHATDAVNKENAPNCAGQLCTMECVPGTIDCNQAELRCISGECKAVMNE